MIMMVLLPDIGRDPVDGFDEYAKSIVPGVDPAANAALVIVINGCNFNGGRTTTSPVSYTHLTLPTIYSV